MADEQIAPLGVIVVPADYAVPNAQEVTLRALFAHFDGTAAGGDFVPTLQIVSDAGLTVATIPQDTTVVAGDSVDATWGPFLRSAKAAAAAAPFMEYLHLIRETNKSITSGVVTSLTWTGRTHVEPFATDILNQYAGAPPIPNTTVDAAAIISYELAVTWPSFAADRYIEVALTGMATDLQLIPPRTRTAVTPDGDVQTVSGICRVADGFPVTVDARVFQASGVNQNVNPCSLVICVLQPLAPA